jgi:hypothetical protein
MNMGGRYGNCMGTDIGSILDGRVDIIGRLDWVGFWS